MNIAKKIVTASVIAATTLASFGTLAEARDGRGYTQRPYAGHGAYRAAPAPHYGYVHRDRERRGNRIATGVAIGVGALILGSILANELRRNHGYNGY